MASSARALGKLPVPQLRASSTTSAAASRSASRLLTTSARRVAQPRPALTSRNVSVSRQLRRAHTEAAAPLPTPKKKGFRTLRWIWRLTYLSAFGGLVYVGYGIYEDRNPDPQTEPDPTKKTLVILGEPGCFRRLLRDVEC